MPNPVLYDLDQGVATLTLNRPDKLNAINYAMADFLLELLDRLEADPDVRVVILTGAGERAFSAGGDIHEFTQSVGRGANAAVSRRCGAAEPQAD